MEDIAGTVEVVIFPELYSRSATILNNDTPVIIEGLVKKDERGDKIIADVVDTLDEACNKYTANAQIMEPIRPRPGKKSDFI